MGPVQLSFFALLLLFLLSSGSAVSKGLKLPHRSIPCFGSFASSGSRLDMEDEHAVHLSKNIQIAAVFDGHGGKGVSSYLKSKMIQYLRDDRMFSIGSSAWRKNETIINSLRSVLHRIDKEVSAEPSMKRQGSTAAVLIVNPANGHSEDASLIAMNVGDSRIVLSRGGVAIDLTKDHKPDLAEERKRIVSAGGSVVWTGLVDPATKENVRGTGIYRVNGVLALSRAIGDESEKPAVSSEPDHYAIARSHLDEFAIVATDGLWDVFTSQDAVDFINQMKKDLWEPRYKAEVGGSPSYRCGGADLQEFLNKAARSLVESALDRGSRDNITVLLVFFCSEPSSQRPERKQDIYV